ncbi:hypothetical protein BI347_18660 [Chromobacterium sphagni]|uniref:DUF2304 domain-containing protein n=1 Tax=Chromobacterium sphagni TaxID=1903179 RepID=A0A1S1WWY7_9NEIS|nr:DUF2304 domain-containing protein [Chromobacterium sphagni]OHX11666.1 hypothetical protein BI347_18660 [Chromobacterium sphagni]
MIFSILLTTAFVFMAVYSFAFIKPNALRILLCLSYCAGIYFAWNPDITSTIAHLFGIGRGLDFFLMLLLIAIINALVLLARHLNAMHLALTNLSRHIALRDARPAEKESK